MSNIRDTKVEAALYLLEDFLAREKERERRGITIEKLFDRIEKVSDKVEKVDANVVVLKHAAETITTEQIGQRIRQDRHAKKLRSLHLRFEGQNGGQGVEVDVDDEPTTSPNMRVEELARAAAAAQDLKKKWELAEAEQKAENQWWRRARYQILGAVVLAMFTASCSGAGSLALWYLTKGNSR
jgi:hypothetical protein